MTITINYCVLFCFSLLYCERQYEINHSCYQGRQNVKNASTVIQGYSGQMPLVRSVFQHTFALCATDAYSPLSGQQLPQQQILLNIKVDHE